MSEEVVNTDDELRSYIESITQDMFVALSEWQAGAPVDWHTAKVERREKLYQLLLADRKKHELQARANELSLIADETGLFTKKRNKAVYNVYLPIQYLFDRVAELKQELEEL